MSLRFSLVHHYSATLYVITVLEKPLPLAG